jgi:hypothetical protein
MKTKATKTSVQAPQLTRAERGGKPTPAQVRTATLKKIYLANYRTTGRNDLATKEAKIPYDTPHGWARTDPEFKRMWAEARYDAATVLEDAAYKRAVKGVRRGVYHRGELIGFEREFSDQMLSLLLKGHKPDIYKERSAVESSGPGGKPIEHQIGLSDEAAMAIRQKILGVGLKKP